MMKVNVQNFFNGPKDNFLAKAIGISTMRDLFHLLIPLALISIGLVSLLWLPNRASAVDRQSIIVELSGLPPTVVAADQARKLRKSFDQAAHEQAIRSAQDAFLAKLQANGIDFTVTETPLFLSGVKSGVPNRFSHLINAVGLDVSSSAIDVIKAMPEVRHVTISEPMHLNLDNSVKYVRANDGPGNKTIFTQGGGPLTRFDGTGQVIAVLDTGIEHTHPAFDSRFDDANFLSRTGDVRPVRVAGQPYVEGVNHPKVVYFLPLTATTNEDDVGHGTHGAADSAGLKVKGPGLDRIPGNTDDQIIEGVAPGALLMNYKVCETLFTCVGTANIVTALEDAVSPTDPAGNPKPVATVINMSFGSTSGDPNDASAVAASNAAVAGAVPVASAGNSGPNENTVGSPSAGRRVISVAATNDPGAATNELDVLVDDPLRYTVAGMSTGAQNDTGRTVAPQDQFMKAVLMGGAPDVTFPLGQHYVYVGFADTPDQIPAEVNGRIALASRGSTVDAGASGTGLFGNKAAEAAAKGAVALLIFNNVDGELEAATTQAAVIPVYGISKANGEYLRDTPTLGFQSGTFDKDNSATWGTISKLPLRINPPDPSTFSPATTGFSSRGPIDNFQNVKPDVTAPGLNIYSATIPVGGVSTGGGTMSDPSRFISVSGTSFSGPHVTGAAALTRQALLQAKGQAPVPAAMLRSGTGAATQQAQNLVVTQSIVRAALTNTATNLRLADGETTLSNTDPRTFIHEIGSGLIHVIGAVDARAAMGTNDANGTSGPDSANDADFLPTYSFGQNQVINTDDPAQSKSITVTLQNISGPTGGGTYSLSLVDGGALRGDITRPIVGTTGFSVSLSTASIPLGVASGNQATFNVNVTVDGRPSPVGLAVAGADDTGAFATEFLWWVVASGSNGEVLRMPFYYRANSTPQVFREAPFQNAILDDTSNDPSPDQVNGVDKDGYYKLSWTFPGEPAEQPCKFQIEQATTLSFIFNDEGNTPLVAGSNSMWTGDAEWISSLHPNTGTPGYSVLYTDNLNTSLTMTNAVPIPPSTKAQLVFDSFEDVEEDFDFVFVEASGDGGPFLPLAKHTGSFSGQRIVDLSGFADQDVKVRFRLTSDSLISTPLWLGWFIDNIKIETANFATIATTADASTLTFDVTDRPSGTYYYRIAGLFGGGCTELGPYSNIRQITVDREGGPQPVAPTASFTAMPNPAEINQTVNFDGSASTDNDTVDCDPGTNANKCIVSYFWSFGDGATSNTGPTTTHSYAAAGTYRATLTVTDNDGQTDNTERFIEVTDGGPKPGEQKVTGGGWIPVPGGQGNFGFNVTKKKVNSALSGHLNYDDRAGTMKVQSESFTSLTITGNSARIEGPCTVNKASGFTCTVDVVDNGESGSSDSFRIRVSSYDRGGTLGGGNIKIHK